MPLPSTLALPNFHRVPSREPARGAKVPEGILFALRALTPAAGRVLGRTAARAGGRQPA